VEEIQKVYSLHKKLGFLALGKTGPNPPVSAILQNEMYEIIASAHTQLYGQNHAERELYSRSPELSGGKLSVSLEPCTHFGRTPPCRDLVLEKRPNQVLVGWKDPNPLVQSGDWQMYQDKGIFIKLDPVLSKISLPFLQGFLKRMQKKKPWVILKSATTKEGYHSELPKNRSKINSFGSDVFLQVLRAKVDAVCVGPGTVATDAPGLDFRLSDDDWDRRGDVTLVHKTPKFYDAAGGLLHELLSIDTEIFSIHKQDLELYQPRRVFFLPKEDSIPNAFFQKQLALIQKYPKVKNVYFSVNDGNAKDQSKDDIYSQSYSKEFLDFVDKTSDTPIIHLTKNDGEYFLNRMAEFGLNSILCESGRFFPEFLGADLEPEDCVLEIRSKTSFKEGILFPYSNEPILTEYWVGEDQWILRKF
jgi:diaminohydroxyphosphoribosylaminopyrimidine deaminase/5-amino-6-(5-phosphoribosylamino)uracil reductase